MAEQRAFGLSDGSADRIASRFAKARRVLGKVEIAGGDKERTEAEQMARNREVNRRTSSLASGGPGAGGGSMQFATGRPRDPLFYWKQNNLPYDTDDDEELKKIREYCRLLYKTHPLIASCIDIYTKYPLLGMELTCKDQAIVDFHEALFLSEEGLNYEEFLVDLGREYWITGEAWPLGAFNEMLGVWESEELLNPDDVKVEQSPFLREPRYFIALPSSLREIIKKRSPAWEYAKLMEAYPELVNYTSDENATMPVSNILLRQLKFKADTFALRGIPILMRAMRSVIQEEMFNSAMDAIADRLYTPLILVKLGASATDLGTSVPWIPTADDLEDFNASLDMAMAADFRVLTHHFATEIESVFGREQMPDMTADFERVEDRMLQAFGLSRTMLTGASSGETYAADALNRDLVSQLLTNFQKLVKRHFRQRALVVAEAQGHYDYDERDGKRYVKTEEILEIDEQGNEYIVEQPKLLIPELQMKTMNLQDEESVREFLETLRGAGVPISIKTRTRNLPIDLEDEIEQTRDEQVRLAVAEQETRKEQYKALRAAGLPIANDLREDFEPKAAQPDGEGAIGEEGGVGMRTPVLGVDPTVTTPNLAATQDDIGADEADGVAQAGAPVVAVDPTQQAAVPPESHEQAEDMPKAASTVAPYSTRANWDGAQQMRHIAVEQRNLERLAREAALEQMSQDDRDLAEAVAKEEPIGTWAGPRHVGMRRHLNIKALKETPMDEWGKRSA